MECALDDKERFKIQKIIEQDKVAPPIIPGKAVPAANASASNNPYKD